MYYVEKVINGELHYKRSPRGEWIKFNSKKLNERIIDLESRLLELFKESQRCTACK